MTLQSWARDLAANYRGAQFKDRFEQGQNQKTAVEFDVLAYQIDLEEHHASLPPR